MEQSLVQFGKTSIAYTVKRGRREKTVAVAVDPVAGVIVRAPQSTSMDRLDSIVHRKAQWILHRRRKVEDLAPAPAKREFVSGETFLYLGRQYRLKISSRARTQEPSIRLTGGRFLISQPASSTPDSARAQLIHWYKARATQRLPDHVAHWAEVLGLEPSTTLIRAQRKRWGSVDAKGAIRLNWRIVQAPPRLIDYVVAHEIAHLRHAEHSRSFWALLGSVMGDYEERRERLRELGGRLVW